MLSKQSQERGSIFFDTEKEAEIEAQRLRSLGYQAMCVEIERAKKPYGVDWRPMREMGTKWNRERHL